MISEGDVVVYTNRDPYAEHQSANVYQLARRIGLVEKVRTYGRFRVRVSWTGWCRLDHQVGHLAVVRALHRSG